jgi:hypothetical protein
MLLWTIQTTIISVILIFLVHHLINFFKSTLTVPKFKDLVNAPTHKYENMFNIINHYNNNNNYNSFTPLITNNNNNNNNNNDTSSDINLLPKSDNDNGNYMKNELKDFLKKQLNNNNSNILS